MSKPVTERPILFSGAMVRALLDGKKTQTRRIVKGAPPCDDPSARWTYCVDSTDRASIGTLSLSVLDAAGNRFTERGREREVAQVRCPYGAPGDRLWVRETWAPCEAKARKGHFQYAADGAVGHEVATNGGERWWERSGHTMGVSDERLSGMWVSKPSRWRPSIHMPRWASRLTLEVTGVRVERLRTLMPTDAIAEGIERGPEPHPSSGISAGWRDYLTGKGTSGPVSSFESLWESINGADSWASNPWVWVVEFKRVTP